MNPGKNRSSIKVHSGIPKTAIIGASGFLGRHFLPVYRTFYPDCVGTVKGDSGGGSMYLHHLNLNFPDIADLRLSACEHKDALIFAAITNVNICEDEKIAARKANVDGTLELIRQLAKEGIKPVFFSSSYVFDGETGSYTSKSPVNPIAEYGKQKAEVEARIGAITNGNFLVIRLAKIFSLDEEDNTFLDEIARILSSGGIYRAAFDQIFCPTLVTDIIGVVTLLQTIGATGIVNVCSPEVWSRYDLAISLAKSMGIAPDKVIRTPLHDIMTSSKCPKNTSMVSDVGLKPDRGFTPMAACIEQVAKRWKSSSKK